MRLDGASADGGAPTGAPAAATFVLAASATAGKRAVTRWAGAGAGPALHVTEEDLYDVEEWCAAWTRMGHGRAWGMDGHGASTGMGHGQMGHAAGESMERGAWAHDLCTSWAPAARVHTTPTRVHTTPARFTLSRPPHHAPTPTTRRPLHFTAFHATRSAAIHIELFDTPIGGAPYGCVVLPAPTNAAKSVVSGLARVVRAGDALRGTLQARDRFGNERWAGGDRVRLMVLRTPRTATVAGASNPARAHPPATPPPATPPAGSRAEMVAEIEAGGGSEAAPSHHAFTPRAGGSDAGERGDSHRGAAAPLSPPRSARRIVLDSQVKPLLACTCHAHAMRMPCTCTAHRP